MAQRVRTHSCLTLVVGLIDTLSSTLSAFLATGDGAAFDIRTSPFRASCLHSLLVWYNGSAKVYGAFGRGKFYPFISTGSADNLVERRRVYS